LREILQLRVHRLTDDKSHNWLALHLPRFVAWAEEYVAARPT
jgi:hypothetical protein